MPEGNIFSDKTRKSKIKTVNHNMKKFFVVMGLAAMLTPLCAQQTTDGERQRELMRQADDLYRKQKYASAQQLYDQVSGQGSVVSGRWADYKGDFVTVSDAAYYAGVCSEKLDNNAVIDCVAFARLVDARRTVSRRQDLVGFGAC